MPVWPQPVFSPHVHSRQAEPHHQHRPRPRPPLTWPAAASGSQLLTEDGVREEVGGKGVTVPEKQGRAALVEAAQPLLPGHRGQAVQRPAVLGPWRPTHSGCRARGGRSRGPRGRGAPLLRLRLQADLGHLGGRGQEHLEQGRGRQG